MASYAQNYPLNSTLQLIPPYSVYLTDYGADEKLRLIIFLKDLTKPTYHIRLHLKVSLNGKVIIQTNRNFNPPPINIEPNIPTLLSGTDLIPYLDSRNMDFIGYDKAKYERTRALPEGAYQICLTAYDYSRRDIQVSNEGCHYYFLSKSEPPLLNTPACNTKIAASLSGLTQPIIFSWLPRNTSSPNSVINTEYEFSLFEVRPWGRNINDVVLTSKPIFQSRVQNPQLIYGLTEPALFDSLQYAWRVQAIDIEGKDAFRNNGFSQPCLFTYGGSTGNTPSLTAAVSNLQAFAENERRGNVSWQTENNGFDSYRVEYKANKEGFDWFKSTTKDKSLKIFDLIPETEYTVRVQGFKDGYAGNYSGIVNFTTPAKKVIACGQRLGILSQELGKPLLGAIPLMPVVANNIPMTLSTIQAVGQPGYYSGTGKVSVPFLGGASYAATFTNIYINENRDVTFGTIYLNSVNIDDWIEEELEKDKQRKETRALALLQEANLEKYNGTDFEDDVILYQMDHIANVTVNNDGTMTLTDDKGKTYSSKDLPAKRDKATVIEDKNGDQWVIGKDGKVEQAKGGGLPPLNTSNVSKITLDIIKKSIKELRQDYSDSKLKELESEKNAGLAAMKDYEIKSKNQIRGLASAKTDSIQNGEILNMDSVPDDEIDASQLSIARTQINSKKDYNRGLIIKIFSKDINTKTEYGLIAKSTKINSKDLEAYITDEKAKNTSDEDLIKIVKISIVDLINSILDKRF